MYYSGDETQKYCKVTLASPRLVPALRGMIQSGISIENPTTRSLMQLPSDVFEANLPFELRYMIDSSMVGCSWIEGP